MEIHNLEKNKINRKEFLTTVGIVGAGLVFGTSFIASCKKEEPKKEEAKTEGPKCDDVTGLSQQDIEQRKNLQYTDNSPDPTKLCSNCALFIEAKDNAPCGGCNLVKGPISPKGWCTSWVPKA